MQEHLSRALTFLKGAASFLIKGVRELAVYAWGHKVVSGIVIVALIGAGIGASIFFKPAGAGPDDSRRGVTLLSVSELSAPEPVSVIGEVRAVSEANVAPDASGAVARVYATLGQYVSAGTALAELKNDSQRAGVAQAQAALDKAKSGATIGGISVSTAQNSLSAAIESSKNTIVSAYATIDDSVRKKADEVFSNPTGGSPTFFVSTSNSQAKLTAESNRAGVTAILSREASAGQPSSDPAAILSELQALSAEAETVRAFLSSVVTALNGAIATGSVTDSAIAGYRADASAALAAVNGLKATLTGSIQSLQAAQNGLQIAEESLTSGTGENADVRAAEANLAAAQANLEHTIIRAPISGTINRLDLDVGSFVTASVPVVYITNANGLEVVAYVSDRDLSDIVRGAAVTVAGSVKGTVSKVASALDPQTKKAEIRISIPQNSALVSGSSASVEIARASKAQNSGEPLSVPLSALKLTPEGAVVFTVNDSGTLVSHPVIMGTLRGSRVDITSGITADMRIVEDARGLKDGQDVIVKGE